MTIRNTLPARPHLLCTRSVLPDSDSFWDSTHDLGARLFHTLSTTFGVLAYLISRALRRPLLQKGSGTGYGFGVGVHHNFLGQDT